MNTHISMVMEGVQAQTLPIRGCVKLNLVQPCYKLFLSNEFMDPAVVIRLSVMAEECSFIFWLKPQECSS